MEIRNEIKAITAKYGWSYTDIVAALNERHGRNDSLQNFSNKINRGTLRYSEALEIAEVIGCTLDWAKKEQEG
ncbi:MAG: DUF6471 domain-containing protein [Gorillibacterium sp.]|nr:DUF6471 domain-containing protein [Gorillibacterium sp.]